MSPRSLLNKRQIKLQLDEANREIEHNEFPLRTFTLFTFNFCNLLKKSSDKSPILREIAFLQTAAFFFDRKYFLMTGEEIVVLI